jgi:hypothetical protein
MRLLLAFLVARLKEPSSYAGLGAMLAALGIHADDAVVAAAVQLLVAAGGLAAVLLPEQGAPPAS